MSDETIDYLWPPIPTKWSTVHRLIASKALLLVDGHDFNGPPSPVRQHTQCAERIVHPRRSERVDEINAGVCGLLPSPTFERSVSEMKCYLAPALHKFGRFGQVARQDSPGK